MSARVCAKSEHARARRRMAETARSQTGSMTLVFHDDVLTREIVLSRKWTMVSICKKYVSLELRNGAIVEYHRYPALDLARVKPLEKLLAENKILYYCSATGSPRIVKPPPEKKERQFVPKTRAEYADKRREGMMAAAARVLDHKAREADRKTWANPEEDNVNDALSSSEEREVDCW